MNRAQNIADDVRVLVILRAHHSRFPRGLTPAMITERTIPSLPGRRVTDAIGRLLDRKLVRIERRRGVPYYRAMPWSDVGRDKEKTG